jgi:hypothetical protein
VFSNKKVIKIFKINPTLTLTLRINSDQNPCFSCDPLSMESGEKTNKTYHLKFSFQLKPPHVISEAVIYSKVSSDITSIIGHTTVFL